MTDCESYRPILLLNLDLKLLVKILVNCLRPLLPKVIGPEQVGFMSGWEVRENVIKAVNLVHRMRLAKVKGLLLSTDIEEAFNRVAWDYIFATCSHVGLGTHMMTWISSPYRRPSVRVMINGSFWTSINNEWYKTRLPFVSVVIYFDSRNIHLHCKP